jgi:hypothetical protein
VGFFLRTPSLKALALAGTLLAGTALAGCSGAGSNPQKTADDMTHAVYANDMAAFTSHFDEKTKATVTRSDLGALSDKMHQLGDLQNIAQHEAKPDEGRYTYDVNFSHGSMLVELRVDPTGNVGAYRVVPQSAPATKAPGSPPAR